MEIDYRYLKEKAKYIRRGAFEMVISAGKGHLGGSLSCTEILVALYYGGILNFNPKNPHWEDRDIFILSKGHANNTLYVVLADLGFFPASVLKNFSKNGSYLCQHCDPQVPGIEIISGSLGHGLGIASGIALGFKLKNKNNMVFTILGDGECQEGSIWEAAMFASHHQLDNLVVFIDRNRISSEDFTENTAHLEPLEAKWKSFGWSVKTVNGHSIKQIIIALNGYRTSMTGMPLMIIANTVKGAGISSLENLPKSHHTLPKGEEIIQAREDLS